jgi:hypothetical protein
MLCSSVAVVSELMALVGRKFFSQEAMESQELGYIANTRVVSVYGNGFPVYPFGTRTPYGHLAYYQHAYTRTSVISGAPSQLCPYHDAAPSLRGVISV